MSSPPYDVLIVGAGVAGSALAHALSTIPREKPLKIALLERSLSEPDRIVGELLQPAGVSALKNLGIADCLVGIDAAIAEGYCIYDDGKKTHIPYPDGRQGRSFHHGKFIMSLRAAAKRARGVEVLEATVCELVEAIGSRRVIGVKARRTQDTEPETFYAGLTVIADGCFSNFRNQVMGNSSVKPLTKSYFVGAVLEDAQLPIPNHGNVVLTKGLGPVLFYRIGKNETRMLVDVKHPLPEDLKSHIITNVLPQMPPLLRPAIDKAVNGDRLRRMPNSFLPPVQQANKHSKKGVVLVGDSWNMRHPLTGGGMTAALNDVVILRDLLSDVKDFAVWEDVQGVIRAWHWARKPLASTINILSVALYELFDAEDECLTVLRNGCLRYLERGGECMQGPVSLLSGIRTSPVSLFNHFFAVAFYSIWVMYTHPKFVQGLSGAKPVNQRPSIEEYPWLILKSFHVFWTACIVFGPLLWSEVRWWAPAA